MRRRIFLRSLVAAGAASLVGCSAYAYQSKYLEVAHQHHRLQGIRQRLRIVAASDVHMPCFYSSSPELVTRINALVPHIFVLAGDTIDRKKNEGLVRSFEKVEANHGKLAVLGNWEYQGKLGLGDLKEEYQKAGFLLLIDEVVEIAGLTIFGFDDFVYGSPDYQILNSWQSKSSPLLAVSHCPESFDFISAASPNPIVTISGHTHGGQIAPFGIVLHTPVGSGSYVHGWYHKGKHSMYVTRGIGTTPGLPIRIGARPELLVLDLLPA